MTVRLFPRAVARSIFATGMHSAAFSRCDPKEARRFAQDLFVWSGQRLVTDADLEEIINLLTRARNGRTNGVPRSVVKQMRRWTDALVAEAKLLQKAYAPPTEDLLEARINGELGLLGF